ncbi:hypothetical protein L2U69_07535 [Zavarzinia compransoris]|uniref:hypothetical protein n=1 Tax=Zavarzinia marina TaxID=2911065 RepID=UPI001F2A7356|nr:hypothetical protein [Zavarzinia marina]MCF4165490.1 hypothetical protein [Zavarzinia marina]
MAIASTGHRHGIMAPSMIGIVLSLATLPIHLLVDHQTSIELAGTLIAVIGAIYFGFAIQAGSLRVMLVEGTVANLFIVAGLASFWVSPWIAPVAYALHGVWDWLHHGLEHSRDLVAPRAWYPPFCAAYDWIFAIGLTAIWLA